MTLAVDALNTTFTAAQDVDHPFIMSSWLQSYRASPAGSRVRLDMQYYAWQHALSEVLLARSTVLVARPEGSDSFLNGWVCGEEWHGTPVVHYVYVKKAYRRAGMGEALVDGLLTELQCRGPGLFTHDRLPGATVARERGWRFEPACLGMKR